MIVVTARVFARAEAIDEVLRLCTEAAAQTVHEPGCLSYEVFRSAAEPDTVLFLERWADMAALQVHFAVPALAEMGARLRELTARRGELTFYEAQEIKP